MKLFKSLKWAKENNKKIFMSNLYGDYYTCYINANIYQKSGELILILITQAKYVEILLSSSDCGSNMFFEFLIIIIFHSRGLITYTKVTAASKKPGLFPPILFSSIMYTTFEKDAFAYEKDAYEFGVRHSYIC